MNQLGNLEKLGILVIVILVVVVGVVAITPKANVDTALFPDEPKIEGPIEPLDPAKDPSIDPVTPGEDSKIGESKVGDPAKWPLGDSRRELGDLPGNNSAGGGANNGLSIGGPGGGTAGGGTVGGGNAIVNPVPAPVEPKTAEYTVQKGDTGASIAKKLLGKATAWSDIVAANPGLDARKLKINQKIKVPTAAAPKAPDNQMPSPFNNGNNGNTGGGLGVVPPMHEPMVPPIVDVPAPTADKTYVVQPGDTLSDIARRELGSASKWHMIVDANPEMGGSEVIRTGMKLRIPSKSAVAAKVPAAKVPTAKETAAPSVGGKSYKVQRGDTLSSIASRMLGSSGRWREIVSANEPILHGSDKISVGMDLTIPSGTDAR
ncbi:MAG: LysM peptidoglycan-binding domain-containing protein [Planctomycetes bacterium]|nr:LysM peptidoglycan-binding domain-containing protein [Planctomycetota bacterium]